MSTLTVPQDVAEPELSEEERKMWDYYEQEVLKAIESDQWTEGTPEYWEKLRKEAHERHKARNL
jgi:hypothetical protein